MGLGYDFTFSHEEFGFMPYASVVRAIYRRDNSAEPLKRNFHILAAVAQIGIFRILKSDLILEDLKSPRKSYYRAGPGGPRLVQFHLVQSLV